jgi:hypothetical protein
MFYTKIIKERSIMTYFSGLLNNFQYSGKLKSLLEVEDVESNSTSATLNILWQRL